MVEFPSAVAVPSTSDYAPKAFDPSLITNPAAAYFQGVQNRQAQQLNDYKIQSAQQQNQLAKAFPNGLPTDPKTGAIDYGQVAQTLARFGDVGGAMSTLQQAPPPMSPLFGGQPQGQPPQGAGGGAPAAAPPMQAQQPQQPPQSQPQQPAPQPAAAAPAPSGGTVSAIASSVGAPSTVAQNVARAIGVDPGAPLNDAQQQRASGLLQGYATRQSGAGLQRLQSAIYGQESGSGANTQTSVTGARGGMQIEPDTFKRYASAGESIDNPADNKAVGDRILADYWKKYGGDPARAAVAYFSGPGNVAPAGSPTPWKNDKADPTGKTVSSYVNDVLRKMGVEQLRQGMSPAGPRVASAFSALPQEAAAAGGAEGRGNLPPSANAVSPRPQPGSGQPGGAAPGAGQANVGAAAAPAPGPAGPVQQQPQQAPQAQPPQQQQPLVPQVPLPPALRGMEPQQAVTAMRQEAARYAQMPNGKAQAAFWNDYADRVEASIKPVPVNSMTSIVDPRTGQPIYQGPGAQALANAGGSPTIDADAERYRQTGTLPPNMGRGVQGEAEARAIRARAAQIEIDSGGDPSQWPGKWQEFKAKGVGLSQGERVRANREENLNLILKAADAAIPAALEASKALPRSDYVPLNKLIQKGEIMSSDPRLVEFGMANLQLAEHWARAMNPTGVMRESDRDKALHFLDTAYGNNTYERAVHQLEKQITRERDAVSGGGTILKGGKAPEPGETGSESGSAKGGKADADGWVKYPQGSIREIGQ